VLKLIDRTELENLDDAGYYGYVGNFCRDIVFSLEFNGKLSSEQLEDAKFLMKNGIGRFEKGSSSHNLIQGAISKLQLLIVLGRPLIADVPDWVYGWREQSR